VGFEPVAYVADPEEGQFLDHQAGDDLSLLRALHGGLHCEQLLLTVEESEEPDLRVIVGTIGLMPMAERPSTRPPRTPVLSMNE
jgi:hypothetical protein